MGVTAVLIVEERLLPWPRPAVCGSRAGVALSSSVFGWRWRRATCRG